MLPSRAHTRFGFGAGPGDAAVRGDPREVVLRQLEGGPPPRPVPAEADDAALQRAYEAFRAAVAARDTESPARREARRALVQVAAAEGASAVDLRVRSTRPFLERLAAFWANHLCISVSGKALVAPLAGRYEREAIRPHLLGRYAQMVLASARHPAMLAYLDNAQSVGPDSRAVQRLARLRRRRPELAERAPRGLNENYARELLELHTLGVDGGYTQADVTQLAALLTGWTATPAARGGVPRFAFVEARHQPGRKTVLGVRYGEGEDEGRRAILALCRHPATARHVAGKLARHFIADEPPADAVDRLARVFRDTDGDLRAVTVALVQEPGPWEAEHRKFRPPQDWLVAAYRQLGLAPPPVATLAALRQLRQPLWAPPSPAGYGDLLRDWADPDALLNRAELARTLVRRAGAGRDADARALELAGPAFQWR